MANILIFGSGGFCGSWLSEYFLARENFEVFGSVRSTMRSDLHNLSKARQHDRFHLINADIEDFAAVQTILKEVQPDRIYNLAAITFVPDSFKFPLKVHQTNTVGVLNILEAVRRSKTDPVIMNAGSSEEFGLTFPSENPLNESSPMRPACLHPRTKVLTASGWRPMSSIRIGDLVMTKENELKPVIAKGSSLHSDMIHIAYNTNDSRDTFKCSPEHAVRVYRDGKEQWVEAQKVMTSDSLYIMSRPCENCGKPTPAFSKRKRFCSHNCQSSHVRRLQWRDDEQYREIMLAAESNRTPTAKRRAGKKSWETKVAIYGYGKLATRLRSQRVKQQEDWFLHPEKHPNCILAKNGHVSKPQKQLYSVLKARYPDAVLNLPIKITATNRLRFADVGIPSLKVDYEYDEPHWHDAEKDTIRDEELRKEGWITVRVVDVNHIPDLPLETDPDFMLIKPVSIRRVPVKKNRRIRLWDITVGANSNYIANGVSVHNSPYGVSKVAAEFYMGQYHLSFGLKTVLPRSFNHDGPRRGKDTLMSNITRQIVAIERGLAPPVVYHGLIDSIRDYTHVDDVCHAYDLLAYKCHYGTPYVIGSGTGHSAGELIDLLIAKSTVKGIKKEHDPARDRPSDIPVMLANAKKFRDATGWKPDVPFSRIPEDLLNYWRVEYH